MNTDKEDNSALMEKVAGMVVSETDKSKERIIELEERFKASTKFLDEATEQINDSWVKWLRESKTYLEEVRTWRLAVEREHKSGIQSCRDALDFLGTEETQSKMAAFRELIELSERLKVLKESGFLDSLVDTLIKIKP